MLKLATSTLPVILIPSYKPDMHLSQLVKQLREQSACEIIIVDDGNDTQEAQQLFQQLQQLDNVTVLHHSVNKGKGAALKTGVAYIQTHYLDTVGCVTADADGQHLASDILKVARQLIKTPDKVVLGMRQFDQANVPARSRIGNQLTAKLFALTTGVTCPDTQTGLRGIPVNEFSAFLIVEGERFEFEMNQLLDVAKRHGVVLSVPIETVYIAENRSSHFNPIKDSFRIMKTLCLFGLMSSVGTLIDLLMFIIFTRLVFSPTATGVLMSGILARIISGATNYYLNMKWVFRTQHRTQTLMKYGLLFSCLMLVSATSVALAPVNLAAKVGVKLLVDGSLFLLSYRIQQQIIFSPPTNELRKEVRI